MSHFDSRLDRILAQGRFLKCLLQVRPKILVCCTYELLPIASFFKSILGYRLVYDVQENYRANLDLNPALSDPARVRASKLIEKAEAVGGIDLFLLAEKCYRKEMPDKRPFLILENKFQGEISPSKPLNFQGKKEFRFCISGTITPAFGTIDAIQWFREILKSYPESRLEIIGHCPVESLWVELTQYDKEIPQLTLFIDRNPVSHDVLIAALEQADFALLPYRNHPAIAGKMPTKLFECAALGIPVLISANPIWEQFLSDFDGGTSMDFLNPSKAADQLRDALDQTYFTTLPPKSILWTTETPHLQQAFQNLFS
ncbi:glycosyltransferase [Algoriphagus terrigena]|uniref:glycosyltransferase n=1 Tax=Algoriphagus terrigena TaxID=344884 RepID=UPI0012F80263|nr:glycosyltransferase [Algoriphagus terrigena]